MTSFASYIGIEEKQTQTKKKKTGFAEFLGMEKQEVTPEQQTRIKIAKEEAKTHPFNPKNPANAEFNTQLDMRAGSQSTLKNFFSSVFQKETYLSKQNIQRSSLQNMFFPKENPLVFEVGEGLNPAQAQNARAQVIRELAAGQRENELRVQLGQPNMDLKKTAIEFAQFTPRAVATLAATLLPERYQTEYSPDTPLIRALIGDDEVVSLARQAANSETYLQESGFGKASTPLAVMGVAANETLALLPIISPLSKAANTRLASLAEQTTKKTGINITFSDAQKIVNGNTAVDPIKLEAFKKTVLNDTNLLQTFRQGALQVTKTEETTLSSFLRKATGSKPGETTFTTTAPTRAGFPTQTPLLTGSVSEVSNAPQPSVSIANSGFPTANPIVKVPVTPKPAHKTAISIEADPLLSEARKYKSAEEFVKAQGKPAFHGSNKASIIEKEGFKIMPSPSARGYGDGIYLTETRSNAKGYGDVVNSYIPKNLKLYQATEADTYKIDAKQLMAEGYDGVKLPGTGGFAIFDPTKIKTKSQLTDIWKKAHADNIIQTRTTGDTPSKIATSIEQKAVEQKLTQGFSGVAGYDPITIADQAKKATDLLTDTTKAMRVIRGEDPLPDGLRGTAIITASEEYIQRTGDVRMAYELANSPLVSETSAAAQELRLAAERQPDSLTAKLQDLRKAREAAITKRLGSFSKAKRSTVKEIKAEITKTTPKAKDWVSFLDELKCT